MFYSKESNLAGDFTSDQNFAKEFLMSKDWKKKVITIEI